MLTTTLGPPPTYISNPHRFISVWSTPIRNNILCVRYRQSVIVATRKVVLQKYGAQTIDCAMNYCVIVWSMFFILLHGDRSRDRFISHWNNALTWGFKRQSL